MDCEAGICTATAKKAVLNVSDLETLLASGDATVKSGIAKNIDIDQAFSWNSASALTLDAKDSITVKRPVTVAGTGSLTIKYNNGGTGGDLQFANNGKADFPNYGSNLVINGQTYILALDVDSLAAEVAQNISGSFALATNVDASNESYDGAPVKRFFGNFEGLGHTISHLVIGGRSGGDIGFFGLSGGVIRDISVRSIEVSVNKGRSGGAIVGSNSGVIAHSHASGRIHAKDGDRQFVGGLAGENDATIVDSSANMRGSISGGLVGWNNGIIDRSFATGGVPAGGGLVGILEQGSITNSYASGSIGAGGGFIGSGSLTVESSYSTGQVAHIGFSGGFVGTVNSNAVQNAYWDTDTSGQSQGCGEGDCSNITGLSDAQLKSGLPKGFDPKIWASDPKINGGYPYLINNPPQ